MTNKIETRQTGSKNHDNYLHFEKVETKKYIYVNKYILSKGMLFPSC